MLTQDEKATERQEQTIHLLRHTSWGPGCHWLLPPQDGVAGEGCWGWRGNYGHSFWVSLCLVSHPCPDSTAGMTELLGDHRHSAAIQRKRINVRVCPYVYTISIILIWWENQTLNKNNLSNSFLLQGLLVYTKLNYIFWEMARKKSNFFSFCS